MKYEKKKTVGEVGYAYRIRFSNENDDILGRIYITEENGHQISYDGYYYLVGADQNINVNFWEELLKDAPPAEPGDEGNDELPDIEPVEWEVNWEWLYGKLPVGKYRIGKVLRILERVGIMIQLPTLSNLKLKNKKY